LKDNAEGFIGGEANKENALQLSYIGAILGTSYKLGPKTAINFNCLIGLAKPSLKYNRYKYTNISPRSHQFNFGISYKFGHKKIIESLPDSK